MGAAASSHDPRHVRIWNNLNGLNSANARLQMLQTLMEGPEYIAATKRAGIYAELLGWMGAQRRGEYFSWPKPYSASPTPSYTQSSPQPPPSFREFMSPPSMGGYGPQTKNMTMPPPPMATKQRQHTQSAALATIAPPKRALDVLHESYMLLGLDDSKPLTHEVLRSAYKRAAIKVHPDKGGSPEAFDAVTRAFTYVEEVLNKLLPKSGAGIGSDDERFSMKVNPENAMRMRGVTSSVAAAPPGTLQLENAPPIALNPKKLDMNVFNKLFEENRLPDPEHDGYGDWLKSQEGRSSSTEVMRGKYNKDLFNKMFEDDAKKTTVPKSDSELATYKAPNDMIMAPGFGTELGVVKKEHFTKSTGHMIGGAGLAYTDLKYAYTDGATFSQEVSGVSLEGRPKTIEQAKTEYNAPPRPLSAEESAAIASIERAREYAEQQRQMRVAARDVDVEEAHNRLKSRLLIRN
jgi:curved DNA-binding protein CbpA